MNERYHPRRLWHRTLRAARRNVLLKVGSLLFAIGLWAFVNLGARDAEKTLSVPLILRNIDRTLMVTNEVVDAIDVRVSGPRTLLGGIDERKQVVLDLSNVRPGTTSFKIDTDMLGLPRGVRATRVSPVQVNLEIARRLEKRLQVTANFGNSVPAGYRVVDLQIQPPFVTAIGPAEELEPIRMIATTPVAIRLASTTFAQTAPIEPPSPLVTVDPPSVSLHGRIEEMLVTKQFSDVDIGAREPTGAWRARPSRADVTIRAPRRILDGFQLTKDTVFVDLSGLGPGSHRVRVQVAVPEAAEVSEIRPGEVTVQIAAAAGKKGR